jgi:tetratricopeptide (TPR) repeat protein
MSSWNRIAYGAAISLGTPSQASSGEGEQLICDVGADYAVGIEDNPKAFSLHAEVVREHPGNALAHYHLGFAEGMMGEKTAELGEYWRAAALGLRNWDLFLNMGLAQLENGDLDAATESLRRAVLLGEGHPESHYNLGLAYERRGLYGDAEHQALASFRLNPDDPDTRNSLALIFAEEGKIAARRGPTPLSATKSTG